MVLSSFHFLLSVQFQSYGYTGCVDAMQNLHFFPPSHGPVEVPIKTTLSNTQDPTAASMSIVLSPDQVLFFLFYLNCCALTLRLRNILFL